MIQDIILYVTDREGNSHELLAPTDMQLNLMEVCKSYEFPVEGNLRWNGTLCFLSGVHGK